MEMQMDIERRAEPLDERHRTLAVRWPGRPN